MLSGGAGARGDVLAHLYALPRPHAGHALTPEFLPPPPRPLARYPARAPPPGLPCAQAPSLYRAPASRTGPGFVPPAPPGRFTRGALIRLESGVLRRVEDMRTEDFVSCAEHSADLALTHCTLLRLEERGAVLSLTLAPHATPAASAQDQVHMQATVEHPLFVYGQGWASAAPERTLQRYGLEVQRLRVGDVCVTLVPRTPAQTQPENLSVREDTRKRRWSAPDPHR